MRNKTQSCNENKWTIQFFKSNGHLALQYLSATPSSTVYVDEDATKWLNQLTTAETGPGSDLK